MSLFNFNSAPKPIDKQVLEKSISASLDADADLFFELDKCDYLSDTIFISDASFSSYQLLNAFLDKFGPSNVWLTTYGISETVMRGLSTRKQSGLIKELYMVFSDHVKKIKPAEVQIAEHIATKFCHYPCHAKIIVVQNDTHQAVIISSMNLNRNNKLEAGCISRNANTVQLVIKKLNSILCT